MLACCISMLRAVYTVSSRNRGDLGWKVKHNPYDNRGANHEKEYVERENTVMLLVVMTPRRSGMIELLPLHVCTNF